MTDNVTKTPAPLLLSLTACLACGLVGFRLGLTHYRQIYEAKRTDMTVATSAAMGNMARIWLTQLDNGQIKKVQESMLGYIKAEYTALSAYLRIPDIHDRNLRYQPALDDIDQFLNEHKNGAQQGVTVRHTKRAVR